MTSKTRIFQRARQLRLALQDYPETSGISFQWCAQFAADIGPFLDTAAILVSANKLHLAVNLAIGALHQERIDRIPDTVETVGIQETTPILDDMTTMIREIFGD